MRTSRLPLGIGKTRSKAFSTLRRETRIPMEVGVNLTGHTVQPGTESTFTENVSSRGARVLSTRKWKIDDRLIISTAAGSFQAVARVAYCELVPQAGFAVGLEFVEPRGTWVISGESAA